MGTNYQVKKTPAQLHFSYDVCLFLKKGFISSFSIESKINELMFIRFAHYFILAFTLISYTAL